MTLDHRRYLERFEMLATRYASTLNICEEIIQRHGIARNIRESTDGKNSFHDYMFLCFTKATKTLGSIYITLTAYRGEDSLILVRSVYEAYLHMAFLLKSPNAINDLVAYKVKEKAGEVIANRKRHRFFDPTTRKEIGEIHSVRNMARKTPWKIDDSIHRFLYPYLCSYSHMDIQSLPYFLDGDRFTTQNKDRIHQAGLYSLFYAILLLDLMGFMNVHSENHRTQVRRSIDSSRKVMEGILLEMQTKGENRGIPARFLNRLQYIGRAWAPKG